MSSDNIKTALASAYPASSEKDWKRRSKSKVAGGTERVFENVALGVTVITVEDASGNVQLAINGAPSPAWIAQDAELASPAPPSPVVSVAPVASNPDVPLRNRMVVNSKWKFTRDVEFTVWRDRDEYNHLSYKRGRTSSEQAEVIRMQDAHECMEQVMVGTIKAGAVITIVGKIAAAERNSYAAKNQTNGLLVPCDLVGDVDLVPMKRDIADHHHPLQAYSFATKSIIHELPLNQISDAIEPLEIPKTIVYVLRDTATGELFGGWKTEKVPSYTDHHGKMQYSDQTTNEPKMVTKLSSAKKYATSAACKASIREFTGYNVGLEEGVDGGAYFIMGGDKKMDLPSTWEMVAFDKITGAEIEAFDVQNWLRATKRLRVLTTTFGSAVRGVYKKAEGKGMAAIIVFQNRSRGVGHDGKSWDEAARFEDYRDGPKSLAAINAALSQVTGKTLREKSPSSIAMAGSLADCFLARMALDSEAQVEVKILDFSTLDEVVETQG